MSERRCPKCAGEMVQGFVLDQTEGSQFVGHWHEGRPRWSFWSGVKAAPYDGIPIGTFRCASCGFLEFYADSQFAAE